MRTGREKGVESTVKEGRFQGGEGGQARRDSLGKVEGSMSGRKRCLGRSAESSFYSQVWPILKWKKRLGDEKPAHKMTERNESEELVGEVENPQRGELG